MKHHFEFLLNVGHYLVLLEALNNDQHLEETQNDVSSNGLEEFGVDMDEPDLFNTSSGSEQSEPLLLEDEQEEDDLEIPAFLRRQKN